LHRSEKNGIFIEYQVTCLHNFSANLSQKCRKTSTFAKSNKLNVGERYY